MKKLLSTSLFLIVILLLTACSSAEEANKDEKTILRVSHPYQAGTLHHHYMEWFDEKLRERSEGRLSLEIYPGSQLMPSDQEIPGILQGQIDITHSLSSIAGSFDPIWYFFDLPLLFSHQFFWYYQFFVS